MRKLLTSKKRNFCYFFTLLSVSAMAFSLVSCGGISKEILDKQINIKKGNEFATGYSLKDVLTSASSSTARSKFSSALVDQILYNWYADFAFGKNSSASYPTTRIQSFADK
jgi:hypothetical protein